MFFKTPIINSRDDISLTQLICIISFAHIYLSGIIAGIIFGASRSRKKLLGVFYALQTRLFASSVFACHLTSIVSFHTGVNLINAEMDRINFGFVYHFGNKWNIALGQTQPFAFGINLVPCLLLFLLFARDYTGSNDDPLLTDEY